MRTGYSNGNDNPPHPPRNLLAAITIRVGSGKATPISVNIWQNRITKIRMTATTMTATLITFRIDECAFYFFLQLHVFLDIHSKSLQDIIENARRFAGGNKVDIEIVKKFWVALQRIGKSGTSLKRPISLGQQWLREIYFQLFRQDFQPLNNRNTGVEKGCELSGKDDKVFFVIFLARFLPRANPDFSSTAMVW